LEQVWVFVGDLDEFNQNVGGVLVECEAERVFLEENG